MTGRAGEQPRPEADPDLGAVGPLASSWPQVETEEHPWTVDPRSSIGKRRRRTIGSSYEAIVVPHIAAVKTLPLDPGIAADAEEAAQEIARFDVTLGATINPFGVILLRSESAASSRIELLDASAKSVALAAIGGEGRNAQQVVANGKAMEAAIELADDLTPGSIVQMQTVLLEHLARHHTGGFRKQQVWVGGSDLWPSPDALMVAPHHTRVADDINDLIGFISRDDLSPVLAHTAIAHAQFETIHPFTDGNGRTGRALAHAMLRAKGVTQKVTVPISAGLLKNTQRYFDSLETYRRGDPNPIVAQFTEATYLGIDNATRLATDVNDIHNKWKDAVRARAGSTARRMLGLLLEQPAIDIPYVAGKFGVSDESARRAVTKLEEAEVLSRSGGGQRYRRWVAQDVLDALDGFAERSR